MALTSRDLAEQRQRQNVRTNDDLSFANRNRILSNQLSRNNSWSNNPLVDPNIDSIWSADIGNTRPAVSYFDYFFTGQDCKIYIDGLEEIDGMPYLCSINSFGYKIEQEKTPVYGFWDYTYSTVMRGTRIITGAFTLTTKYPNFMTDLLAGAARHRAQGLASTVIRDLDEDESNIERYWTKNRNDQDIAINDFKHLFSSHPPFNFVIVYGVQSPSISDNPIARREAVYNKYKNSPAKFVDTNERLVPADADYATRRVIEHVELVNMATQYDAEGQVCTELYSFFARDCYYPR